MLHLVGCLHCCTARSHKHQVWHTLYLLFIISDAEHNGCSKGKHKYRNPSPTAVLPITKCKYPFFWIAFGLPGGKYSDTNLETRVSYILNEFCVRYSCTFRNYFLLHWYFKMNLYLKIKLYDRHFNCEVVSSTLINPLTLKMEFK